MYLSEVGEAPFVETHSAESDEAKSMSEDRFLETGSCCSEGSTCAGSSASFFDGGLNSDGSGLSFCVVAMFLYGLAFGVFPCHRGAIELILRPLMWCRYFESLARSCSATPIPEAN